MPNPTGNVVREIALPRTFFAIIATNATVGIVPFTVNATVNAIGGTPPYQFTWDFGDGTQQTTGNIVAHTYSSPGTYILKVTALDTYGNQATSAVYLTVNTVTSGLSVSGVSISESESNFTKENIGFSKPITIENMKITSETISFTKTPALTSDNIKITSEIIKFPQPYSENVSISNESITFKNS